MIKNEISYVSRTEAEGLKLGIGSVTFVAEIDGKYIRTGEDYLREAWKKFKFPYPNEIPSWDAYNDWIRDLDWLDADGYALFIYDFSLFMNGDKENREYFMSSFIRLILPFWEDEVTRVVVGGKAKPFNVYLVD